MQPQRPSWFIIALAFILLRTIFALAVDVAAVNAKNDCSPYADNIFDQWGTNQVGMAKCAPDEKFDTVGHKPDSFLILDMGEGNEIVDNLGLDFYYYERPFDPGIQLDRVEVAVAQDDGSGIPGPFTVVFIWGDENLENNGALPSNYNPEVPNKPIDASDLHNDTGIGIDIGLDDGTAYRFVRFQTHPTDAMPADEELVEVDAVEGIHHPPSPTLTPTPIPIETPSPTATPLLSETPFEIPTSTSTLNETPTDTPIGGAIPSETETVTPTQIPSSTYASTSTSTAATEPTGLTFTSTATFTPATTLTATYTLSATSTSTSTPTASFTFTNTPTTTYTPSNTSTATITPTPTATQTPRPKPTRTPTKTPFPYTPPVASNTSPPSATNTPTSIFTATLTTTQTSTLTFTSTATYIPNNTATLELTFTPIYTSTYAVTTKIPTAVPSQVPPNEPSQSNLEASLGWAALLGIVSALASGIMGNWLYDVFFRESAEKFRKFLQSQKPNFRNNFFETINKIKSALTETSTRARFYLVNGVKSVNQRLNLKSNESNPSDDEEQ